MNTFSFLLGGGEQAGEYLTVMVLRDETRAREWAQRLLARSPRADSIEIRLGRASLCVVERAASAPIAPWRQPAASTGRASSRAALAAITDAVRGIAGGLRLAIAAPKPGSHPAA